jgi:hypothetical protein
MRILTPTIIANNESQPSTAGALLRIHDQDATSGESLLIVSSDDSDYYFKVASNGRVHFRGNATDGDGQIKVHLQHSGFTGAASSLIWDSSGGANQMSIRQSEENSDLFVYAHAQSLNLAEFARTTADVTFNAQVTVNGQGSDILDLYDNAATPVNVFKVQNDGAVHLGAYGSGTFTGTAAYTLAVDSSGNVIEITPTDANTTYDLTSAQSGTDVDITLTGSDATTDTVTLVAGDAITLTDDGSNNVTIATDGTSESTHIAVKNTSGSTITKGTPVYITGNVGSSDRLQIAPADASDSAKMPAVGLLETDLINNAEGYVVQGGYLRNLTTATIDGTSTSSNDTVYVKAGGGLTMTKPTGSTNYIQNIAKVARVGTASEGSLIVSSILRTNDIPNLADGQVWVGSTTYPVGTDFNLQEVTDGGNTTTNSIGIGVLSPSAFLEIANPTYSDATVLLGRQAGYPTIQGNGTSGGQWLMLDSNGGYLALNNHVTDNVILAWGGGDVAVGTGSPLARFHVKGSGNTSATTALLVENSSGTDTFKVLNDGQAQLGNYGSGTFTGTVSKVLAVESNGNIIETTLSDLSGVDGSGTANYLPKWSDSDTLTDSVMYDNGTYVGIGTTSPNNELEILGSNSPRISLRTSNEAVSEALELGFQVGTGANASSNSVGLIKSVITQATPSALIGDMEFQTNSGDAISTKMIIKGDGNVGIGTTNPSAKLDIEGGTVRIGGNHPTSPFASQLYLDAPVSSDSVLNFHQAGSQVGKLGYDASLSGIAFVSGTGSFATADMVILDGGNVGIGTSTPSAKLHIFDSGTSYTNLTEGITLSNNAGSTNDRLPSITWDYGTAGTPTFAAIETTRASSIGGNLVFHTAQTNGTLTERMRITSTGAVGIGTTSPSGQLHVNTEAAESTKVYIDGEASQEKSIQIRHYDASEGSGVGRNLFYLKTPSAGRLDLGGFTDGSTEFQTMTFLESGAVGIGTTNPGAKLHVQRSDDGGIGIFRGTSNAQLIIGIDSSNLFYDASNGNANHVFKSNDIERMRITSTGAVGIGTSTPSGRVNIQSAAASTYLLNLDYSDGTDGGGFYEASSTDLSLFLKNSSGTNTVTIATDGDSFLNGGNVGIGTSTPVGKLTVNTGTSTANLNISNQENGSISFHNNATNKGFPTIVGKSNDGAGLNLISATNDTNSNWDMQFNVRENDNSDFTTLTSTAFLFSRSSTKLLTILRNGAVGIGTSSPSASTHIVGSGNTSSTTALLVESNNGTDRLRVTDGSEVFVNASTLHYGADVAATTLGYKEFLTDVDYGTLNTGAISVYTSESTRDTIMCDYKIYDGTNIRVGTVTATTDGTSVDYTDIRKAEVGDTSDMYFYAQLSGSNLQLIFYRGSAGYDAKYIIKNF